jgi:hypothetical protein
MTTVKLASACLAAILACAANAFADPDPNFHVFLCFGQSNMESGARMSDMDRTADPRFQVLADFDAPGRGWQKGHWYAAVPPLTARGRGLSLVDYFGRTMAANLPESHRVGVVKCSVPGTKIELWDKDAYKTYLANLPASDAWKVTAANGYGGNPYQYLVDLARVAQKDGAIRGILIHQGESNFQDPDWPRKVGKIYGDLVKDLDLKPADVTLLAGEVVNADHRGEKAAFNEILKRLPETLPNSHVISSAGLPCNPDHLHFTSDGLREFGRRYAEAMLKVMGYKADLPTEPYVRPAAAAAAAAAPGPATRPTTVPAPGSH